MEHLKDALLTNIKLSWKYLARDEQSGLLQTFVHYDCKKSFLMLGQKMLTIFQEFLPFPFGPAQIKFSGPIGKFKASLHSRQTQPNFQ